MNSSKSFNPKSVSHTESRNAVWNLLYDQVVQQDPDLGKVTLALIDAIANNENSALTNAGELQKTIADIFEAHPLSDEQKFNLTNIMALVSHLSRAASIASAHNDRNNPKEGNISKPVVQHMVDQLVSYGLEHPKQIIHHLKQISIDNVFTAHPTYIGDLDHAKKLRALDAAILAGDEGEIGAQIADVLSSNALVENRLTAQGETVYMRHYLKNCYRSVRDVYAHMDEAIGSVKTHETYNPLELKLDIGFQSWGSSGDKDGNNNVTFQSLRDAIHTHRECIINSYIEDLNKITRLMPEDPRYNYAEKQIELASKLHHLVDFGSNASALPDEQNIESILAEVKGFAKRSYNKAEYLLSHPHDEVEISDDIKRELKEASYRALGLYRTIDTFGLHLGQIEFRETADEHQFVLNHVIDASLIKQALGEDAPDSLHYSKLDPEQKNAVINHILKNWDDLEADIQSNIAQAYAQTPAEAKTRRFEYADSGEGKDNYGIFLHTIERLRLASRNPDMFKGQVLAEATKPVQVKEMLLLLKATGNDHNMRIMPLFEDPKVLKEDEFRPTLDKLNRDPFVLAHNIDVSLREWDEKVAKELRPELGDEIKDAIRALPDLLGDSETFKNAVAEINTQIRKQTKSQTNQTGYQLANVINTQIQLAHSDNARRGGTVGARARIYKAHDIARAAAKDLGIGVNFYEGGSHTDSFRMGVRSYRSLVNMYNNHRFMKCTVQGMDLTQLFSNAASIESFLEENIANAARAIREQEIGVEKLSKRKQEQYRKRKAMDIDDLINPAMDRVAHYREEYFGTQHKPNIILGNILAQVFSYQENKDSGTVGSRSGGRSGAEDMSLYINPVKETRTIGYSETFQHGRLNPNYIGTGDLREHLMKNGVGNGELEGRPEFNKIIKATPKGERLNVMYKNSPFLRDAIDRTAYAVATTDFEKIWDNAIHDYSSDTKQQRNIVIGTREQIEAQGDAVEKQTIETRPAPSDLEALAAQKDTSAAGMLAWLEVEYRDAAKMVLEAIGKETVDLDRLETRELTSKVKALLPMYQEHFAMQDVLMETADTIRNTTPKSVRDGAMGTVTNGMNKAIHNLKDLATLIRPPFQIELINKGIKKEPEIENSRSRAL